MPRAVLCKKRRGFVIDERKELIEGVMNGLKEQAERADMVPDGARGGLLSSTHLPPLRANL